MLAFITRICGRITAALDKAQKDREFMDSIYPPVNPRRWD